MPQADKFVSDLRLLSDPNVPPKVNLYVILEGGGFRFCTVPFDPSETITKSRFTAERNVHPALAFESKGRVRCAGEVSVISSPKTGAVFAVLINNCSGHYVPREVTSSELARCLSGHLHAGLKAVVLAVCGDGYAIFLTGMGGGHCMTIDIMSAAQDAITRASQLSKGDAEASSIAATVLAGFPAFSRGEIMEFLMRRLSGLKSPGGSVANWRFGEPSLILAHNSEWVFELIVWNHMVTAVHEHSVDGAFKTIVGRRLHLSFSYEPRGSVDEQGTSYGMLNCKHSELLLPASVRAIRKGTDFIHSVWPIDKPSMTFVLNRRGPSDSYSYVPGAVRFNERSAENRLSDLREYAQLAQLSPNHFVGAVRNLVSDGRVSDAFLVCLTCVGILREDNLPSLAFNSALPEAVSTALQDAIRIERLFSDVLSLRRRTDRTEELLDLGIAFYSSFVADTHLSRIAGFRDVSGVSSLKIAGS